MSEIIRLACACGQIHLEVQSTPIISAECHCNSCRAAGARLQALPAARPFLEANGGTRFVLYRKDRVRFVEGAGRLKEFRLTSSATTRRAIATCCNTPVFLEFHGGHWLSLYSCLWPKGTLPPLDIRTMTRDLPDASSLADDVPSGARHTLWFYAKLLGAWIAMGFKSPKITIFNGEIHA
jgi:hypothetical protein